MVKKEALVIILSVSRRTDIPNYHAAWFLQRVKEGYVCVRNPLNKHQVSKVKITPEVVDCVVFWTKNPAPLMRRLDELAKYHYYFQFTLNGYGKEVEPGILSQDVLVATFRRLAAAVGKESVIWRYDPILITERYPADYHIAHFSALAKQLKGYTEKCVVSFVDFYRTNRKILQQMKLRQTDLSAREALLGHLAEIAGACGMRLETCAEEGGFSHLGVEPAHCIDAALIERLTGSRLRVEKDKNQRFACGCAVSVDIGAYNTCFSGCAYCYANYSAPLCCGPESPLLGSTLEPEDIIKERRAESLKMLQGSLF